MATGQQKIVGILMAYNCASMIERAYQSIPKQYFDHILCVDDGSTDNTLTLAQGLGIPVYTHPHSGYGGNLFFGMQKALELGATHMIELHGDGQYNFAAVPVALERVREGCDLVLGNRFHKYLEPLRDGMDIARFLGNLFLSTIGRLGLGLPNRDLFPGFRVYSRRFVEALGLEGMSKNYFFSFEIIAQARYIGLRICQVPVQCDYKGEHTSMKLSAGIPAILHTFYTVVCYRLARSNIKCGVFKGLSVLPK